MSRNPESTARVAGHPIHPMLVYFPIAFFVGAFASDLLALGLTDPSFWAKASFYLIGAGLVMAVLTALSGVIDFLGESRIRKLSEAWWHAGANIVVVVLEAVSWATRYGTSLSAVSARDALLSAVCVLLLLFSGWKGGEMVYRHRVAVLDDERR